MESGSGRSTLWGRILYHNLTLRIASALIMAPVTVGVTYLGDWPFAIFWALASAAVLWEWMTLIGVRASPLLFAAGAAGLTVAMIVAQRQRPVTAMLAVGLGAFASAVFAPSKQRNWTMAGLGYAGALLLAPVLLRDDDDYGFIAIMFLFAVVWTTDILGYFVGRAIGGPKLAPSISPGKTWSGAIGGTVGTLAVAYVTGRYFFANNTITLLVLALVLSVASQAGDLLESGVKRHFNAKDASHLIPGHGGVMDRLDGFWAAALLAAIIGILRGGFDHPARGLLIW